MCQRLQEATAIASERPKDLTPLSLLARIAIALHLFRGYCSRRGLNHAEIDRFVEHLWAFIAMPQGRGVFGSWTSNEPLLLHAGLGDGLPPGFDLVLRAADVPEDEFLEVLSCTTEVFYSSMYGAADEPGSQRFLSGLATIAESIGVEWPDMRCFSRFKWSDGHGWGRRPSAQELFAWRFGLTISERL